MNWEGKEEFLILVLFNRIYFEMNIFKHYLIFNKIDFYQTFIAQPKPDGAKKKSLIQKKTHSKCGFYILKGI